MFYSSYFKTESVHLNVSTHNIIQYKVGIRHIVFCLKSGRISIKIISCVSSAINSLSGAWGYRHEINRTRVSRARKMRVPYSVTKSAVALTESKASELLLFCSGKFTILKWFIKFQIIIASLSLKHLTILFNHHQIYILIVPCYSQELFTFTTLI